MPSQEKSAAVYSVVQYSAAGRLLTTLLPELRNRFLFGRLNRDVGELDPMADAALPSRHYCRRGDTLRLKEPHCLACVFEVFHCNIESHIHFVIEVGDRPRVHDT